MALRPSERNLIIGAVLLAGILAFYSWVHQPLFARRASAHEAADQTTMELKREKARLAKEGDLNGRQAAVEARERTIDAWVPGKNSAVLFIWHLSQAEMRSGAKVRGVTIGDRQEVQVRTAGGVAPAPGSQADPSGQPDQAPPDQATQPNQTQPVQAAPGAADSVITSLTVVDLDLQVDARFTEHLLFNQALEEMPLLWNTHMLSLIPTEQAQLEEVGKLVQEGRTWMAGQLLSSSPVLGGSYKIRLYFKSAKVGPPTDTMQFAEPTGRMDPFVMDGVDEFLQVLVDYFANPDGFVPQDDLWPASPAPADPNTSKQLG